MELPDYEEIRESISKRSNDELRQMLTVDRTDYRQEVVEFARDELRRRGGHELRHVLYETPIAVSEADDAYGSAKAPFGRRLNADTVDGVIALALMLVPIFLVASIAEYLPNSFQHLGVVGLLAALLYILLRDAVGGGASPGKKLMRLKLIDLRTGNACAFSRLCLRNVTDFVPVLNTIDFIIMCVDKRGQKLMDKLLRIQVVDSRVTMPGEA